MTKRSEDDGEHDMALAVTPDAPYIAVIFTSIRTSEDSGYEEMAAALLRSVRAQDGYLGVESAHEALGITVSYWRDEGAARAWKTVAEHLVAQRLGRDEWYRSYRVRVARVVRDYGFPDEARK